MRQTISLALTWLIMMPLVPAGLGADVANQIAGMPLGATIELRLKNKHKMRGTRGPVANSGFTLFDERKAEHEIAFDDVVSVKQLDKNSHVRRNVLIGVGVGVAAVGITAGILLRCAPLGCGNHRL